MPQPRKRAVRSADNGVGEERYKLYKAAFEWISKSISEGFYLEAISLEESLITDRLESYLTWLKGSNFGFMTLGQLQKEIEKHEIDISLRSLILTDLNQWRKARNKASHEMVKMKDKEKISWNDRTKINQAVAQEGLKLVRKIDQQTRKLRAK